MHHSRRILTIFTSILLILALQSCDTESSVSKSTKEKILIMGNTNEPQTLDPQLAQGLIESNILRGLFEGLTNNDPKDALAPLPGAAQSWEHNADFTEWTFKLQPEARWSDGKPVTAKDFLFAYHRILHPKFAAPYSSLLYFIKGAKDYNENNRGKYLLTPEQLNCSQETFDKINFRGWEKEATKKWINAWEKNSSGKEWKTAKFESLSKADKITHLDIQGLDALDKKQLTFLSHNLDQLAWAKELSPEAQSTLINTLVENLDKDLWESANVGVEAPDDHTLKITLSAPCTFLLELTRHFTWYPVPEHIVLKHGTIHEKFNPWTKPENFVSNGPYKMKTWLFNYYIDLEQNTYYWDKDTLKLKGLKFYPISNQSTEARMFYNNQLHVTASLSPQHIKYAKTNFSKQFHQDPGYNCTFLRLNTNDPKLSDQNLRLALAHSVNSQEIIDYIKRGGEQLADGFVPPLANYTATGGNTYDTEKAKEYFAKTKYASNPSSLKLKVMITDRGDSSYIAQALQAMWKKTLNIEVDIESKEWSIYLGDLKNLNYGVATGGWYADYADPTTFLDMFRTGDGNNRTGWTNPDYDALLTKATTISDSNERIKILKEAEAILIKESPIIPICWASINYLLHTDVKGWEPHILHNHPYKFMDLEQTK